MTQTTQSTRRAMPTIPVDALAHLVAHHGWTSGPADPTMVQAHRYAHGVDGRPDLADASVDHTHDRPAPTSPPDLATDYLRRIHWWVRLFGIIWIVIPILAVLAAFGFLMGVSIGSVD